MKRKSYKSGTISALFVLSLLLAGLVLVPAASAGVNKWTKQLDLDNPGWANDIVFSPGFATDHTVFVPTGNGGVFKSVDGGNTWAAMGGLGTSRISSLAVSPDYDHDQTVFITNWSNGQAEKSTDGGNTFSELTQISSLWGSPNNVSVSPNYANDHTVFISTGGSGLWKSTDGGANWTQNSDNPSYAGKVYFSPNYANDNTLFRDDYKSTDGGNTWVQFGVSFPFCCNSHNFAVSPDYAQDQTVFAYNTGGGIYKSVDGGGTWNRVGGNCSVGDGCTNPTGLNNQSITDVSISPNFDQDQTLFVSTTDYAPGSGYYPGDVYKSTDGGNTWNELNAGFVDDQGDSLACTSQNNDCKSADAVAVSPDFAADRTVLAGYSSYPIDPFHNGAGIFSYTTDSNPVCSAPSLSLSENRVYWASLDDFNARSLSIDFTIANDGSDLAYDTQFTGSISTDNVNLQTLTPVSWGPVNFGVLFAGQSVPFTLKYQVPAGVTSFKTTISATAQDACGDVYNYPPPR
ncbi:MAG: glycoside hydrolase [Actinobacteria bacterium]|nr:glycoside hydrolase [Actinomycetota bacterium]